MKCVDDIQEHIIHKKFPLVVTGHAGLNKLQTVLNILDRLGLKCKRIYSEEGKHIYKPLVKCISVLHNHFDKEILNKLTYFTNIIIVTDVFIKTKKHQVYQVFVNSALHSKKHKFFKTTTKLMNDYSEVTIKRAAGRIFNKKISGKQLSVEYDQLTKQGTFTFALPSNFKPKKITEKDNYFHNTRRFLSEDSNTESETENNSEINFCQTFNLQYFIDILHHNFLPFTSLETMHEFYDILSLTDIEKNNLITFCCYSSQKSTKPVKFQYFSNPYKQDTSNT
ncbi:hypothetical protein EHP00_1262 [Ecytonucleospora hepatopenaei]|uniref:Uncharacterized protein n=1 Tax=Ecytonucleospora hepatopenaei TaxID=646526 RepID=A0A1W0E6B5_9MICR|nr:hypothetical protein EHP00_1262 [Ecytonucleospora hepatopenaei]